MTYSPTAHQAMVASSLPTHYFSRLALDNYAYAYGEDRPMYLGISSDYAGAVAYYDSLAEDILREEATEILAMNGWTLDSVCRKYS